jgi:aminotransferase in exopolysaccharide biosynthesis
MIPLSVPHIFGNEAKYVLDCIQTGWVSSAGAYVTKFEEAVAEYTGAKYAVACMNGTAGLHLGLRLLHIQRDDLIICPNITFIATLNSITYANARPLLVDVDSSTWQMDIDLLERKLESETYQEEGYTFLKSSKQKIAAIMPVHVLGNIGDMDKLKNISRKYQLPIIEDSTESLGSFHKGKHTGTFGKLGVFSFNGNKILTTGGGGMIVTDDEKLAVRGKHLSTQAKVSANEYIHDEVGYNYRLVNVLAAIGVAQMENFETVLKRKHEIDNYYRTELKGIGDIQFQEVREDVDPNYWLCTIHTSKMRSLLQHLNDNKIISRPFWMPMNQLEMFKNDTYFSHENHSANIYENCLSIPSSSNLTDEQLETVVGAIKEIY